MNNKIDPIFIIGALNRSGTNFLSDILQLDPEIVSPENIGEDYFLVYSDLLKRYCSQTTKHWGKSWRTDDCNVRNELMECLGAEILNFSLKNTLPNKRYVFKTPRANNLENFWEMFPNGKVLLLVRDGGDTVDSFLKSFDNYGFIQVIRLWLEGVAKIKNFIKKSRLENKEDKFLFLKYENLSRADPIVIKELCNFCHLNPKDITSDAILNIPLRGSSVIRGGNKKIHWGQVPKPNDYNPHGKIKKWSYLKRFLFRFLAKKTMVGLGYNLF